MARSTEKQQIQPKISLVVFVEGYVVKPYLLARQVTCVTAHCAAAIAVLATVAALTLLPSVRNTSLK